MENSIGRKKSKLPAKPRRHPSLLSQIICQWLVSLPTPFPVAEVLSQSPWTYMIYPPLLLLPTNTFSSPPWPSGLIETLRPHLPALYSLLCTSMKVTHIALNGHVPSLSHQEIPNILRTPNITPLHGDFTTPQSPSHPPTPSDLASAFWCTVRQNGIFQTWAPLHTMFSRGNISEKTRLLSLPSVTESRLGADLAHTSVVDLYAGIGYFAFCYAKAGVGTVLCWEMSGWSIEGLRRGAAKNGWSARIMPTTESSGATETENPTTASNTTALTPSKPPQADKFLIFHESNIHASTRIAASRTQIPPIRHVNCGLLPSSRASWETAVATLDPCLGGWVHVHENAPRASIASKREEVVNEFVRLVGVSGVGGEVGGGGREGVLGLGLEKEWRVECGDVFVVKGYGPGVVHLVFDVEILPRDG